TRLTLARWLFAPENPLTARVAVNRLWQEVFGRGIVYTSADFGTQGDRPTHPELLDWLAAEFSQRGWSTRQMVRLLVTSATYRQTINFDAPNSNLSCNRRERTDTPLQALNLMNDPMFFEAAQALAFRIMRESTGGFRDRLNFAYQVTLGRLPSTSETERMGKY